MSDFLAELVAVGQPVERDIKVGDKIGKVFFRRITAGQRVKLLAGQKYRGGGADGGSIEIDLQESERMKHLMVLFSVCDAEGKPAFKTSDDVAKLEAVTVDALYAVAKDINKGDDGDAKNG